MEPTKKQLKQIEDIRKRFWKEIFGIDDGGFAFWPNGGTQLAFAKIIEPGNISNVLIDNIHNVRDDLNEEKDIPAFIAKLEKTVDTAIAKHKKQLAKQLAKHAKNANVPKKSPLELVAFGNERQDAPREPDTQLEKQMWKELYGHFEHAWPVTQGTTNFLSKMIAGGYYKDLLVKPDVTKLYRGLSVTKPVLQSLIGSANTAVGHKKISKKYKRAKSWASSWTKDVSKTFDFAMNKSYTVIFVAKTADNKNKFLDARNMYDDIEDIAHFDDEEECIGLGAIQASEVYWIKTALLSPFFFRKLVDKKKQMTPAERKGVEFFDTARY